MAKTLRITVKPFIGGGFEYSVGGFTAFGFATREAARSAADAFRATLNGEAV